MGRMALDDMVRALGLEEFREGLSIGWEESMDTMPEDLFFFLDGRYIAGLCEKLCLHEGIISDAIGFAGRIGTDPALRALAWHSHRIIFQRAIYPFDGRFRDLPTVEALKKPFGDLAGLFYFIIFLSGLPGKLERMEEMHRSRSIPAEVTRNTFEDISIKLEIYRRKHSTWGLEDSSLIGWFMYHLEGELFGLGRLQFQFVRFGNWIRIFRNKRDGLVLALREDGIVEGEDFVEGYPILPTGEVMNERACLSKWEWTQAVNPEDFTLSVHIHGGGPMDFELCGESFERAVDFFPKHFPERPIMAYTCLSWVLDTELQDLLSERSNMVRFQREFYLFPTFLEGSGELLLKAAFGRVPESTDTLPEDTFLRRALIERMRQGRPLNSRAGGGFILVSDLNWGSQHYLGRMRELMSGIISGFAR